MSVRHNSCIGASVLAEVSRLDEHLKFPYDFKILYAVKNVG